MKINCEHARIYVEIREYRVTRKKQPREREKGERRERENGDGAVVIKEFSFEKRSPETHLAAERELGMRSNEWSFARAF